MSDVGGGAKKVVGGAKMVGGGDAAATIFENVCKNNLKGEYF